MRAGVGGSAAQRAVAARRLGRAAVANAVRESTLVERVEVPSGTLAAVALEPADYADAFRARIALGGPADVDAFARLLMTSLPAWVGRLLRARNAIVGVLGLKTDGPRTVPARFEPGTAVGLFEVFARTEDEILFGANDSHLDFRLSCLVRDGAATLTTVVRFHGRSGRAYFAVVRPFHTRMVPAMLRAALA